LNIKVVESKKLIKNNDDTEYFLIEIEGMNEFKRNYQIIRSVKDISKLIQDLSENLHDQIACTKYLMKY